LFAFTLFHSSDTNQKLCERNVFHYLTRGRRARTPKEVQLDENVGEEFLDGIGGAGGRDSGLGKQIA
jgi:hypothetical protein